MTEFMVARDPIDPSHLAVAAMNGAPEESTIGCSVHVSHDGGKTWSATLFPPPIGSAYMGDPWASFDLRGRLHLICLTQDPSGITSATIRYARSDDGGTRWSAFMPVPTAGGANADKLALYATKSGRLLICYTQALPDDATDADLVIARSDDDGAHWDYSVATRHLGAACNGLLETNDGKVFAGFVSANSTDPNFPTGGLGVSRSDDGGVTWDQPVLVGTAGDQTTANPILPLFVDEAAAVYAGLLPHFPSLAADPRTSELWIAGSLKDATSGKWRVVLYHSNDAGSHFETAAPSQPASPICDLAWMDPSITVDPVTGLVALITICRDATKVETQGFEVWLMATSDRAANWSTPTALSASVAPFTNASPSANTNPLISVRYSDTGDYWLSSADGGAINAFWIDYESLGVPQIWTEQFRAQ